MKEQDCRMNVEASLSNLAQITLPFPVLRTIEVKVACSRLTLVATRSGLLPRVIESNLEDVPVNDVTLKREEE